MAIPRYFDENRYSYLAATWHGAVNTDYQTESPVTRFEKRVHRMYLEGQRHFHHDEFRLALDTFRELQALILKTADPKMPLDPHRIAGFKFPRDATLVNALIGRSADILINTPVETHTFPPEVIAKKSALAPAVQSKLKSAIATDLQVTSHHGAVIDRVTLATKSAEKGNWKDALTHLNEALEMTPRTDNLVRASLLHDLSIFKEKLNQRQEAVQFAAQSIELFAAARRPQAQVHALFTQSGIFARGGKADLAKQAVTQANALQKRHNLHHIAIQPLRETSPSALRPTGLGRLTLTGRLTPTGGVLGDRVEDETVERQISTTEVPALMGTQYIGQEAETKTLTLGASGAASIVIDRRATANVSRFARSLASAAKLELLTDFWRTPIQMVPYLPHLYFFVLPMAIGDCLAGLGNLEDAEEEYLSVLAYPFINKKFEIVRWWTRLAELYLDMGDEAYRRAKDNAQGWDAAKVHYEKILLTSGQVPARSPLYQNAKLATIKRRVTDFLAASNPVAHQDNPRILTKVLRARVKLNQIQAGLNFFGFAPGYLPPFSFEYLQNTARYFAQNAAQIEQQYIQYKSTAENEEFRREQLDQQADVARQTVILEQRGLAEANAGIQVANASVNYAEVQRQNAVQAKQDFQNVRWELLELAEAEAWANASSVDRDDQVKLTWNGHYYSSSKKRRNVVLKELAYQRTRISHDLEANKLDREIDSATAYKAIAQAQLTQAQARRDVALQRIQIAELQQRQAEENRDFMDMKEFSARLWYELAREARRLSRRYLDMAIEVAMLMERAYNAETERGLHIIRFEYGRASTQDLLESSRLLLDIDHFTFDHATTIKPKKSPVKKTISLADRRPMAFHQLQSTGKCFFQTELQDFDREHPGLYLCKLRSVDLLFVGITESATSIAGTLRNVGVSKFRTESGAVLSRQYPADVMPLSQYDIRQDTLAFRFSPNDLKLFENNGIDTMWQLELPLDANDFDFNEILDIQMVLYYDGFFSPALETQVKNNLPIRDTASRAVSMRLWFPDELFYLKNQGDAELVFAPDQFPRNQTNLQRSDVVVKALGDPGVFNGLTLRLRSENLNREIKLQTNADGEVNDSTPGRPLRQLRNKSMFDTWTIRITEADNPGLVVDGRVDLRGIQDILVFFEYGFDYR
jgi:hypothetical protein